MIVHRRIGILDEALAELCQRFYVRELSLFGSVLRDDFHDDSDIDLLVEYEPEARVTLFDHFELEEELQRLMRRKVDLVSKRGLRPILRDEILGSMQVIYAE
jgi:predicted nucleotidyltransferase